MTKADIVKSLHQLFVLVCVSEIVAAVYQILECYFTAHEHWPQGCHCHNVYENIVLPVELDGDVADKKFMDEIVRMLALEDKLQNMPNNLSGGQQQRVAIARALITKPAIILADEPTGNLDSKTSADVLGLLKRTSMEFNQTIVMITHNNEIAQLADRIVRIEDGRIVGGGRQARRDLGKLSDEMLPASHKLRSDS